MKTFSVYILECSDKSYYIGVTSSLEKRLQQHNVGYNEKAYTFKRRPVYLKWFQNFIDPNLAIRKEKQLKGWSRKKKMALIEKDWGKLIAYSKNYTENGASTGSA